MSTSVVESDKKAPSKQWMASFQAYADYKREQESSNRRPCVDTKTIATWAKNQRQQYCLLCAGKKSQMTPKKIELLKSIDFPFVVNSGRPSLSQDASTGSSGIKSVSGGFTVPAMAVADSSTSSNESVTDSDGGSIWFASFQRLRAYKQAHGTCIVTSDHSLQAWVVAQRQDEKNGTLGSYRRNMLLKIGFCFPSRTLARAKEASDDEASFCSNDDAEEENNIVMPTRRAKAPSPSKIPAHYGNNEKESGRDYATASDDANTNTMLTKVAKAPFPAKIPLTATCTAEPTSKTMVQSTCSSSTNGEVPVSSHGAAVDDAGAKVVPKGAALTPLVAANFSPAVIPAAASNEISTAWLFAKTPKSTKRPRAKVIWAGPPSDFLECGWPPGWIKRTFERASGKTKGLTDSYWYCPNTGKKLRSMVEVRRSLGLIEQENDGHRTNCNIATLPRVKASPVLLAAPLKGAKKDIGKNNAVKKPPARRHARKKKWIKKNTGPRFTENDLRLIRAFVPK